MENFWKYFEIEHSVGMTGKEAKRLRKFLPSNISQFIGFDNRFFENSDMQATYHRALKRLDEVIQKHGNSPYVDIRFTIGEAFLIRVALENEGNARNYHLRALEEVFNCEFIIWKAFDRAFLMLYRSFPKQKSLILDLLKKSIKRYEESGG